MSPDRAELIAVLIAAYLVSANQRLASVYAVVAYSFLDDSTSWPIVHWKDTGGNNVLTIFSFHDNRRELCSWLMHSVASSGAHKTIYNVIGLPVLKDLLEATQHALGTFLMPQDIVRQLSPNNISPGSESPHVEYIPFHPYSVIAHA